MGFTTKTALREIMRCTILVLSLAIIYATASPMAEDHIIPEESLFALDDDLSEAQQKINEMTAAGKSDKDCRKLVTETRKDIETNVNNCQKNMDALHNGKECPSRGQGDVKTATEAKSKADKHYKYTVTEVTKASSASVNFGSRTFSSLTEGKCESFYSSTSYTTAEATYKAAVTARTKAKGAAEQADKELKAAIEAAAKAKKECECQVKKVTRRNSLSSVLPTPPTRRHGSLHAWLSVCSMARPAVGALLPPSARGPSSPLPSMLHSASLPRSATERSPSTS